MTIHHHTLVHSYVGYVMASEFRIHRRCHPGEGKKWASETEGCVQEPVCNTTHMGKVDSTRCQ
eukprot:9306974-Ditylum_brightwellii.AAC.1